MNFHHLVAIKYVCFLKKSVFERIFTRALISARLLCQTIVSGYNCASSRDCDNCNANNNNHYDNHTNDAGEGDEAPGVISPGRHGVISL